MNAVINELLLGNPQQFFGNTVGRVINTVDLVPMWH